jgi:hypothetical protein
VQGKPNKKLEKKKKRLFIGSFVLANAIINFIRVLKEIEMKKVEMIKFITFQLLQSEEKGKQMMIQGQLQMVALFIDVLKPKTIDGSGSSGN